MHFFMTYQGLDLVSSEPLAHWSNAPKLSFFYLNIFNAEKVMHIKGRLLYQAMILYNYVPFQMGTLLKGKNLLSEGAISFL